MSGLTLERAQKHLDAWLEAELAVTTGQSYKIGDRSINRADLPEIRQSIKYWRREVVRLQKKPRRKAYRAVPRDL